MRAQLLRQCTRLMGGHPDLGEEAFSRATLRAIERFPRLRESVGDPRGWFARVAYNTCTDLRKELNLLQTGIDETPDRFDRLIRLAGTPQTDAESRLLHDERRNLVRESIERLPSRLREPMRMLVFDDSDPDTIAAALRISAAAVRKRLQEARVFVRMDVELPQRRGGLAVARRDDVEALPLFAVLTPVSIALPSGAVREVELLHEARPPASARAVARIERYVTRHPAGWRKRVELARAYVVAGRIADAIAEYERAVSRTPAPIGAVFEMIELLVAERCPARAIDVCERIEWRNDRWLGDALRASIATDIDRLRDALRQTPPGPRAALIAGRIALQTGLGGDAADFLARATPTPVMLALLHDALVASRQSESISEDVLAAAIRLSPAYPAPIARTERPALVPDAKTLYASDWCRYAISLAGSGRRMAAYVAVSHALRLDPDDDRTVVVAARCTAAVARLSETHALLTRLLDRPLACDVALAAADLAAAIPLDAQMIGALMSTLSIHRNVAAAADATGRLRHLLSHTRSPQEIAARASQIPVSRES